MEFHDITIKSSSDYKINFGNKYCLGKELKKEYIGDTFVFHFENCVHNPEITRGFKQIKNKYENLAEFYHVSILDFDRIIRIDINSTQDYCVFYNSFVNFANNNCFITEKYKDFEFQFHIYYSTNNKINEFLIHNYLLLRYKFADNYNKFKLEIHGREKQKNEDIARITTYVADCKQEIKESIHFNKTELFHRDMNIGKLFPALFIDKETLHFLREPIDSKIWDIIISSQKIDINSFKGIEGFEIVQKHWFLFQVCQKYLFEEFHKNNSNAYTELRGAVFKNSKFKNHILKMPLLAVILFAQYDYFYRDSILKEYKTKIGKNRLNICDIILDLQEQQDYDYYVKHKEMFEKGTNIKSLVKFKNFDKSKKSPDFKNEENIIIHENIIAELFEATTIAEGLLQLMENAVEHANGGLLSIRIREFIDKDKTYLLNEYETYFNKLPPLEHAKFYLEVKLSDIAHCDFKTTFLNNIKDRSQKDLELQNWYRKYGQTINDFKGIFSPFFEPDDNTKLAWKEYYEICNNQIHHFGLQIFDSIITTKKGLLHISGHKDEYSKNNHKIKNDKNICGTSYRILLPINHTSNESMNIIADTAYQNVMDFVALEEYKVSTEKFRICEPNWCFLKKCIDEYKNDKKEKEEIISEICNCFKELKQQNKYMLLINYSNINNPTNYALEVLLKGLLLFLIQNTNNSPPIAIINLPSHSLLEASRIIALFYGKNGEGAQNMKNIQLYLKGIEVGEEILFAGNNLNQIADRLRRIAMTRGLMFEYWQIAQFLIQRTD